MLRDATDDRYPYQDEDETKKRTERRRWVVFRYGGAFSDGLRFLIIRQLAFIGENEEWDRAECMDDAKNFTVPMVKSG